jgi:Do/DeqQ family serine protease
MTKSCYCSFGLRFYREGLKIIGLVLVLISGCQRQDSAPPKTEAPKQSPQARDAAPSENSRVTPQVSYADVVDRVGPGVVTIRSERRVRAPRQFPFSNDPLLREFFGGLFGGAAQGRESRQMGIGSGVIVRSDGYILTNHHVVDGAQEIRIEFTDRRGFNAKLIGSDPPSDLAVLKIDAKDLTALSLGNSDDVRVGDVVLAVGNPLGIGQTVTAGIISAKGRSTGLSDGSFEDFLQTDAPINQGNSGGALINTNGLLVGINSQIVSPSGGNIGIGFAIPSNMARVVMEQLINSGKVERGHLGIAIQPVTPEIAAKLKLSESRGVIVENVAPDSAAARAGIRPGDVIVGFNGQPVSDGNTLRNQVAATRPGAEAELSVLRDGREQKVRVILGEYKPPTAAQRAK